MGPDDDDRGGGGAECDAYRSGSDESYVDNLRGGYAVMPS